jgi:hypothetical protein
MLGLCSAYHTTSCRSRRNTNQCHDKKSRGPSAAGPTLGFGLAHVSFHLLIRRLLALCLVWLALADYWFRIPCPHEHHNLSDQKRIKYMSIQGFTIPVLANIPPRAATESRSALSVQLCRIQPATKLLPSAQLADCLPKKPVSTAPVSEISSRCSVKGCVFPASREGHQKCHYHELQQSEAALFQSHQPSLLLLLYAPYGIPNHESDDSRQKDRQQQAAAREAFILDEAAEWES